ncbi:Methyltransferase domain-containing protein [Rhodovastum atsumiense]|uniref:Methyltransferase domain-containing protein n=1 Tax=Rhodovastum atsumiense TaxID=504468 RepID=A0A5M6IKQ1_9PROT|nr:class I SAM-dependent methyltransferase [Rhodovastum atsumiense]KAA5608841.1 methyltransferase domain-containing protein [Rhodovastum atsumiense]CAH2599334.1 Methyltransferase domain-containing protein [Rhodovastum atsumiense]
MTALDAWRAGRISAEVAVARLVLAGEQDAIAAVPELASVAKRHGLAALQAVRTAVNHAMPATPAAIGRMFDAAVAASPEASVAACSLGDATLLARASAELRSWLCHEDLLQPGATVLDLGCGIGRMTATLAPVATSVLGLDVSPGMIATARQRCTVANARFALTDGTGLGELPDAGFDLVLAADSFPYLVQAGVAERHVIDAARVLRPGGALVVLNWSYRSLDQDRAEADTWAARHGFALRAAGTAPFSLWDGTAFVLIAARRSC